MFGVAGDHATAELRLQETHHRRRHVRWCAMCCVRAHATRRRRRGYWYQQDGTPPHVTPTVTRFPKAKFACCVISCNFERHCPRYSPDLTCPDFSFWLQGQEEVVCKKPQALSQLKSIVEDFGHCISKEQLDGWHATAGAGLSCAAQNEVAISSTCRKRKLSGKKEVFDTKCLMIVFTMVCHLLLWVSIYACDHDLTLCHLVLNTL